MRAGGVSVDGVVVTAPSTKVKAGARITLQIPEAEPARPAPRAIPLDIIHEDDALIVINKAAGMVVHPAAGHHDDTLVNALLAHCGDSLSGIGGVRRPGIVHRLDKDTSGLMVVARNEIAQTHLVRQLQARSMGREYVALVHGWIERPGRVDRPIGRDPRVPVRMSVERPVAPKPAVTHYAPSRLGAAGPGVRVSEVVCRLETGRTHQIRVHLASLGHPLLADALYGGKNAAGALRQMLHARALHFDDPAGRGAVSFHAAPPPDMLQVQEAIEWNA